MVLVHDSVSSSVKWGRYQYRPDGWLWGLTVYTQEVLRPGHAGCDPVLQIIKHLLLNNWWKQDSPAGFSMFCKRLFHTNAETVVKGSSVLTFRDSTEETLGAGALLVTLSAQTGFLPPVLL